MFRSRKDFCSDLVTNLFLNFRQFDPKLGAKFASPDNIVVMCGKNIAVAGNGISVQHAVHFPPGVALVTGTSSSLHGEDHDQSDDTHNEARYEPPKCALKHQFIRNIVVTSIGETQLKSWFSKKSICINIWWYRI